MQYGSVPAGPTVSGTLPAEGRQKTRPKQLSLHLTKIINQIFSFALTKNLYLKQKRNAIKSIYTNYLSSNNDKNNNTIEKTPIIIKDIGHFMGVFALVTNIVQEHRYKNKEEIFKGLCRSDAWGCIDELNSIQLKVLSILASIISAIQD